MIVPTTEAQLYNISVYLKSISDALDLINDHLRDIAYELKHYNKQVKQ